MMLSPEGSFVLRASGFPSHFSTLDLKNHFMQFDISLFITDVKIIGTSKALITFSSAKHLARALDKVNYSIINNREFYLSRYCPGGIAQRLQSKLYVKNLDRSMRSRDLLKLFEEFGMILACQVKYNANGRSKGWGFVHFEKESDARKALETMNGKAVNGYKLEVTLFKLHAVHFMQNQIQSHDTDYSSLFVKGIPKNYKEEDLKHLFGEYGDIAGLKVVKEDNVSMGSGFVCFKNAEDARKAEKELNNKKIEEEKLYVVPALSGKWQKQLLKKQRLKMYKNCNLYVGGLPKYCTDDWLKTFFSEFGEVCSARVMVKLEQDPDTKAIITESKGYGFVCFSNPEEAQKALKQMDRQFPQLNLKVAIAERKEERKMKRWNLLTSAPYEPFCCAYNPCIAAFPPHTQSPTANKFLRAHEFPLLPHATCAPQIWTKPAAKEIIEEGVQTCLSIDPGREKEGLGKEVYKRIIELAPKEIAEITDMFLELSSETMWKLISNPEELKSWTAKAQTAIRGSKI